MSIAFLDEFVKCTVPRRYKQGLSSVGIPKDNFPRSSRFFLQKLSGAIVPFGFELGSMRGNTQGVTSFHIPTVLSKVTIEIADLIGSFHVTRPAQVLLHRCLDRNSQLRD